MLDISDIQVTPLSPACGAEISGIDLGEPLSERQVRAIKDAWGKHLVLVFRGQKLSQDDQLRFASYFGELGSRKKAPAALRGRAEGIQQDHEKVLLVTNIKVDGQPIGAFGDGEFWFHIDSGYSERPYRYTLPLRTRAAFDRRQHDVLQHVQGVRGGAAGAQGEAQGQESAPHP
jgi:alpha-ketoglutarate-dependent taurine dioxygenase